WSPSRRTPCRSPSPSAAPSWCRWWSPAWCCRRCCAARTADGTAAGARRHRHEHPHPSARVRAGADARCLPGRVLAPPAHRPARAASWLARRPGRPGVLSPVLVTTAIVAPVLLLTGLPYQVYLEQVSLLTMLLGPAPVALALPLLRNGRARAGSAPAVTAALVVGGVFSIALTVGVLGLFDVGDDVLRAALPRSVTSPVGLSIAEALQASVPLAVVLTMVSGVLGAAFGPALLSLARVRDDRARGFAVGLTSHGI